MDRSGNKDDRQAAALLRKHRDGTLTPQERAALDGWYLHRARTAEPLRDPEVYARRIQELDEAFPFSQPAPVRRITRWLPYAAAAAILLAVGWLLLVDSRESAVSLAATDILPGGNRATLTLADGRVINLDEAQTGIIVGAEDITYTDGSTLAAVIPSAAEESLQNRRDSSTPLRSAQNDGLTMLSLTTPKGGTYQITLPDGSRVWLNSNSTLKYPSRFSGDERVVELTGEAFFEIRQQAGKVGANKYSPFNVQTAGQVVQVLGTQFNLSAYPDDPETKTTLVEGKVKVTPGTQTGLTTDDLRLTTNVLTPGQQSIVRNDNIQVETVDTEQYTAWKDGYFTSEGDVHALFKQIGRWYDIEVVYQGDKTAAVRFYTQLQRDLPLGDLLDAIQAMDPTLRFRVERISKQGDSPTAGRRLTIFR